MTPTEPSREALLDVLQRTNRWLTVAVAVVAAILIAGLVWLVSCSIGGVWHT